MPAPRRTLSDGLTVGAAAAQVGVTVRTLHHWDEVGLASPSERTAAGYRLYTPADVARLHRVLVYRELDVPLDRIAALLDGADGTATDGDAGTAELVAQRDALRARIARLEVMADGLDRLIEARRRGVLLSDAEQVEVFGDHWQPAWNAQARERWGDSDQWAQHAERSAGRTADDWRTVAAGLDQVTAALAAACLAGVPPESDTGDALAEQHRAALSSFFDCTYAMHVCLGRAYTTTPEYTAHYDTAAPGLAAWLRDAIDANARRHGVDPQTATWG